MSKVEQVKIRKFKFEDIAAKVEWINNPENNQYLHYDLPLEYDKTVLWYERIKNREDRYDAVIEADGVPVGLIGLLSIVDKKAEYYISMGNTSYKGKGVAFSASKLLLEYAFEKLYLDKVYLYTEKDNIAAQRLFEKIGFHVERLLENDIMSRGHYVDRYVCSITRDDYYKMIDIPPIQKIGTWNKNILYIKRDDMIPYSFGGNKARKAKLFFEEIDEGGYDSVVTYGSSHSNHCRIVANMAAQRKIPCYIIAPMEVSDDTFNSHFMKMFGADIIVVPVKDVHDTIEEKIRTLKSNGRMPYFIPGGGHGNIGTQAYRNCYEEICCYERAEDISFDYIFFASGTGTTQAGLVCGKLLNNDNKEIIGISIARKNPRGREFILDSIREYLKENKKDIIEDSIQSATIFVDEYIADGYGKENKEIDEVIKQGMVQYGIPLDSTYTAKAFYGMQQYMQREKLNGKKILFIHTGGTPLFFDDMRRFENEYFDS